MDVVVGHGDPRTAWPQVASLYEGKVFLDVDKAERYICINGEWTKEDN